MIFFSAAARFSLVEFFRIGRDIRFPVVRGFDADDLNRGFSFNLFNAVVLNFWTDEIFQCYDGRLNGVFFVGSERFSVRSDRTGNARIQRSLSSLLE